MTAKTVTPIHNATLDFIARHRFDRATGRHHDLLLHEVSEPMRQRIIDLAMMEPPLVDMDGPRVVMTLSGLKQLAEIRGALIDCPKECAE